MEGTVVATMDDLMSVVGSALSIGCGVVVLVFTPSQ